MTYYFYYLQICSKIQIHVSNFLTYKAAVLNVKYESFQFYRFHILLSTGDNSMFLKISFLKVEITFRKQTPRFVVTNLQDFRPTNNQLRAV